MTSSSGESPSWAAWCADPRRSDGGRAGPAHRAALPGRWVQDRAGRSRTDRDVRTSARAQAVRRLALDPMDRRRKGADRFGLRLNYGRYDGPRKPPNFLMLLEP